MKFINVKIDCEFDGTGEVYVRANKRDIAKFMHMLEVTNLPMWFTGWDLTANGFYFNYDESLLGTEDIEEFIENAEYAVEFLDKLSNGKSTRDILLDEFSVDNAY